MRYQFQRTVVVEGTTHHAGDVVYGSALPSGSVPGLLRMGHAVPLGPEPEPAAEPGPPAQPTEAAEQATPKKPAKK